MKKTALATAIVSLLSHAYTSPVFAQNTTTETDETMVVTANRFEQSESSILASVSVVTKEEIELLQAKTLTEVLRYIPGIQVGESGGPANTTSVFLRGSESNHTLVLLNGMKINNASSGGFDFSIIPIETIEQVEVIRGPRAAVYGADAIGGVINLITKTESKESFHQIKTTVGSDAYYQTSWQSKGQLNDDTYGSFLVNYKESDGYNIKEGTSSDSDSEYGYESKDFIASIDHRFTDVLSINFDVFYVDSLSDYDKYGSFSKQDSEFFQFNTELNYINDNYSSVVNLAKSIQENNSYPESNSSLNSIFKTDRSTFNWLNSYQYTSNLVINAGLDFTNEDVSSGTTDYTKKDRTNKAVFVTTTADINDFTLDGSFRFDKDSGFGDFTTWSAALAYAFNNHLKTYASYGTAFKAPSFYDLYDPNRGNPELDAEESNSAEIGLIGQFDVMNWRLSIFNSDIKDMIVYYEHLNWAPINTDAEIKGVEFEGDFTTWFIDHHISLALMDPKDSEGKQLARRAKETGSWIGTLVQDEWDTSLGMTYQGDRYSDYSNNDKLDAYMLWNLSANYYVTSKMTISGKVNNLFNEEYQTALDYVTQERSYYLSASYIF
ncbi:TonB-dependent receptor [uncultured Aliivibrio sp.]|uniref:TonB-dependent receptor domain-containing protein n=1 Tax=uncultured Aliivibrio sp. TaxID=873085 RepID=UPI00260DC45C|nr:TonB-dependent receptor [uncultured Aliivibrio sp.]